MKKTTIQCLFFLLLTLNQLPAQAPFGNLSAADETAIRDINRQYVEAWLANDTEGVLRFFEPAARLSPSGLCPIDSLQNIRRFWFPDDGSVTTIHRFISHILALQGSGSMAMTTQKTFLDWSYEKGETQLAKMQEGYAVSIYRKQPDGRWKIWRQQWTDIWSRDTDIPQLFAPGVISAENPEFASTFSPDGQVVYFNRTSPDRSKIYLLQAEKQAEHWEQPYFPGFADTLFRDLDPFISPDGNRLFFASNRPLQDGQAKDFYLWVCEKKSSGWSKPSVLGMGVNTGEDEIYSTISAAGSLYFTRFSGRKGKILKSLFQNGSFQPAVPVLLPVADTCSVSNPAISPDERWLVFVSGELTGRGAADLFASRNNGDGTWSPPVNLRKINSTDSEFAPAFSPDGQYLYFTSERPGVVRDFPEGKRRPGDIYRILWSDVEPRPDEYDHP